MEQHGQQVGVSDGQRILLRNRRHVREYRTPADPTMSADDVFPTARKERSKPIQPEPLQKEVPALQERLMTTTEQASRDITSSPPVESQPASTVAIGRSATYIEQPFQDLKSSPPVESQPAFTANREGLRESNKGRSLHEEGRTTRSARLSKLTAKAKEAAL